MIAEDKLLLDKAYDAIHLAERRNIPRFLGFLNEHESLYLRQHLPKSADVAFYGGYPDAVRLMMGAAAEEESFPITALEFTYREQDDLRHRDFLGSLMALGIRRDTLGDILTGKGRTVIFVRDDIVPFLLSDVDKIGRVGVTRIPLSCRSPTIPRSCCSLSAHCGSTRLSPPPRVCRAIRRRG